MAIALRSTTTVGLTVSSFNAPATTLKNDMVVIVAGSANANWSNGSSTLPNNTTVTWSGLGATWVSFAYNNGGAQNGYAVWIGYGCSAGNTTITRSGTPASTTGAYAVAQFSGVAPSNPIVSYTAISSNASSGSGVTLVVPFRQGQLLLATCESFGWSTTTGTWGSYSDTLAVQAGTARIPLIDYLIAPVNTTGSGFFWNSPYSAAGQIFNAGQAFVISPANSNFLSFA